VRSLIGIHPDKTPSSSSCLHTNVTTEEAVALGLVDYSQNSAIEYWGGHGTPNKIVLSPCNGGKLLSYYCFFPREKGDYATQKWDAESTVEELLAPYPDLDRQVFKHLSIGKDIRPWRLWVHKPYEWWQKGVACVMGDAAHPVRLLLHFFLQAIVLIIPESKMMPDQSQGACMAIEDAAALGLVFSKEHFRGDVRQALEVYEQTRKPRATRVQAASQRARENIYERIGMFSDGKISPS
jgi:salicylate hydroxylase